MAAKIVTICGSMRFTEQMLQVADDETAAGRIVLMPFPLLAVALDGQARSAFKAMLDALHRQRIDMSDSIIVVTNQHGYVGESTLSEMVYAMQRGMTADIREFKLPEPTPNKYVGVGPG